MKIKRGVALGIMFAAIVILGAGTTYWFIKRCGTCSPETSWKDFSSSRDWSRDLALTKEQEDVIKPRKKNLKENLSALQVKLTEERISLCRMLGDESVPSDAILKAAEKVSALGAEQQSLVINHLIFMREHLTPEQREKLFSTLAHDICVGCQGMVPGHKCVCGMCQGEGGSARGPCASSCTFAMKGRALSAKCPAHAETPASGQKCPFSPRT